MEDVELPRPKRRCAQRTARNLPSATHYVGYVEEEETPEMIMKKFEELERVMQRASSQAGQQSGTAHVETNAHPSGGSGASNPSHASTDGLDEAALLEVVHTSNGPGATPCDPM